MFHLQMCERATYGLGRLSFFVYFETFTSDDIEMYPDAAAFSFPNT